ncbi:Protein SlyX, partial [Dissostichus eleginoides]
MYSMLLQITQTLGSVMWNHGILNCGSLGDLSGEEENTADHLSLSGEEGGASDPDDSAEGDSSSPPPYPALYNQ